MADTCEAIVVYPACAYDVGSYCLGATRLSGAYVRKYGNLGGGGLVRIDRRTDGLQQPAILALLFPSRCCLYIYRQKTIARDSGHG